MCCYPEPSERSRDAPAAIDPGGGAGRVTNPVRQSLGEDLVMRVDDDAVVISNANTTVGYARFSKADRTVDYVFVHPSFRRRGFGRLLIAACEQECGCRLCPAPPISPLGLKLFSETSGKISSDDIVNQLK